MINLKIKDEILSILLNIEKEENVKILFACESGSRAWGFSSSDSDYDVRFIYIRDIDWYLSINLEDKRDVIELPLNNFKDISGWDLRKTLKLLQKSNPPLLEWLNSPIIYKDSFNFMKNITAIIPKFYSAETCMYHYLNMAEGNFREYLQGNVVWIKKYFYVLRPLLAIKWLEAGHGIVPVEFNILLDAVVHEEKLREEIRILLERKMEGDELDRGPSIPAIDKFINDELKRLRTKKIEKQNNINNFKILNTFFQKTLMQNSD